MEQQETVAVKSRILAVQGVDASLRLADKRRISGERLCGGVR